MIIPKKRKPVPVFKIQGKIWYGDRYPERCDSLVQGDSIKPDMCILYLLAPQIRSSGNKWYASLSKV